MFEMVPHDGVGPLKLGMSPADIATILGPPTETADPSAFSFLTPERRAMFRGQQIEKRKKDKFFKLIDLVYFDGRLVIININGKADNVHVGGHLLAGDRMSLLNHVAKLDRDIFVKSENYLFLTQGIIISRPSNRKDINYGQVVDVAFKRRFLEFEFYKAHVGPILP